MKRKRIDVHTPLPNGEASLAGPNGQTDGGNQVISSGVGNIGQKKKKKPRTALIPQTNITTTNYNSSRSWWQFSNTTSRQLVQRMQFSRWNTFTFIDMDVYQ